MADVDQTMLDLRAVDCDVLTLGQYLSPSRHHLPVVEYIHPDKFLELGAKAKAMGFKWVASGPKVRSSYHAGDFVNATKPVIST
jgi:lipoic acid synthetase